MVPTTSEPRTARPWWVRLIGWLVALAIVVSGVVFVLNRSTYGATTHTVASGTSTPDDSEPAATVSVLASYPADSRLAGSSVVRMSERGVIALDPATGAERWRYQRADSSVCASQVNPRRIVLIFGSSGRCDQAISLDPDSGTRQWQRTIEAAEANRIRFNDDGFVSVDRTKVIVYESTQGFERFTVDTSKNGDVEGPQSSCENIDAAGLNLVVALQRCRSDDKAPWVAQLVVNSASDGKPREDGRSYLTGLANPELLGVTADGAAFVRGADGTIDLYPVGAAQPSTPAGLPSMGKQVEVLSARGAVVLSDSASAYALNPTRTAVQWSVPVAAAPSAYGVRLYIPTAEGVQLREISSAALLRTVTLPAPIASGVEVQVSGPLVGVRDEQALTIYR